MTRRNCPEAPDYLARRRPSECPQRAVGQFARSYDPEQILWAEALTDVFHLV